jgi:ribosomal protein L35
MAKIKKFKPKTHNGAKKRLGVSKPKSGTAKIMTTRTNHAHRLINKSGERKLRAARKTTVSSVHKKYLKIVK